LDVSYVYTVSARGCLIDEALNSVKSLRRYVDKKDVIVYFTPPSDSQAVERLSQYAIVRNVDNLTKPFEFKKERPPGRYGEKIHLCDVESPIVVFLDADTTVKKDPASLIEGDFDFSARRQFPSDEETAREMDEHAWSEIFERLGREPIPMPGAGFMIFKNHLHTKIREEWLGYINDDDLPNACRYCNPKEQTALALAMNGARVRWLTAKECAYKWLDEEAVDTFVLHGPSYPFAQLDGVKRILPRRLRGHTRAFINRFTK
jgi:hypothetical protein